MTSPDTETRLLAAIADAIWCLEHNAPLSACAALRSALASRGEAVRRPQREEATT